MVSAPILCKKALTSSSFGIDGAAPFRVTEIAAAALALSMAAAGASPRASPATRYPVKVSPAAVVSTAFTR